MLGHVFKSVSRRFFDVRIAMSRSVSYIFSLLYVAILFFGIEFIIEKSFYNNDEAVDIFCAVAGAFSFLLIRAYFDRATDAIFFRKEYSYEMAVNNIGPLLNATIDLKVLLREIHEFLLLTVRPSAVVFVLDEASSPLSFCRTYDSIPRGIPDNEYRALIDRFFIDFKEPIFIEQLDDAEAIVPMANALGVAAIIPLALKEEPPAVMLLGSRLSGCGFRNKDISLITMLAHQTGMAIRNARLYEAVRQYNDVLELRVAERTEKIRSMYESQSKFLTEISHELQTPIAILRGNIEALESDGRSEKSSALRVIHTTVDDMARLVSNLLESARLKFVKNIFYKSEVCVGVY